MRPPIGPSSLCGPDAKLWGQSLTRSLKERNRHHVDNISNEKVLPPTRMCLIQTHPSGGNTFSELTWDRNPTKILKTTAPSRLLADIGSVGLLFSIIKSQVPVRRCASKYHKTFQSCCTLRHRRATSACRCSFPARFLQCKHATIIK